MTLAAANQTVDGYYDAVKGKVHTGVRMKTAMNLGWHFYWNTGKPFLNMIKGVGQGQWDSQYPDNTTSAVNYTISVMDRFPEGTYVLEWDGANEMFLSFGPGPMTETLNLYPGQNRKEYTTSAATGFTSAIQAQVFAGAQVSNVQFYDKAYETEYKGGQFLHPDYIADISVNDIIRVKDWMRGDGVRWETYAAYPALDTVTWYGGVPVQVLCEVANSTGAEIFICVPHKFQTADRVAMANDFLTYLDPGKKLWVEWGNEVWNSADPWGEEYWWNGLNDIAVTEVATSTGDGIFTLVGHGMQMSQQVRAYSNDIEPSYQNGSPYFVGGGALRVTDVIDANTFRCGHYGNGGWYIPGTRKGNATGGSGATILSDTSKTWNPNELIGYRVFNESDTSPGGTGAVSAGIITSNTSNTITFAGGMSGGVANTFATGNIYTIMNYNTPDRLSESVIAIADSGTLNTIVDAARTEANGTFDGLDIVITGGGSTGANYGITYTISSYVVGTFTLTGNGAEAFTNETYEVQWAVPNRFSRLLFKQAPFSQLSPQPAKAAVEMVACWADFDSVLGRDRVVHVGSTWFKSDDYSNFMMQVPEFRAAMDIQCSAYYYSWQPKPDEVDIPSLTDQEIYDLAQNNFAINQTDDLPFLRAARGVSRSCYYEGGPNYTDSIGPSGTPQTEANKARMNAYMQTQTYRDQNQYFFENVLAADATEWLCWFFSHNSNEDASSVDSPNLQGMQAWRGKQTDPAFEMYTDYKTAGGIPKP